MAPDEVPEVLNRIADELFATIADGSGTAMKPILMPVIDGIRYIAANAAQLRFDSAASHAGVGVTIQSLRSYQQLLRAASRRTGEIQSTIERAIAAIQSVIQQLESQ